MIHGFVFGAGKKRAEKKEATNRRHRARGCAKAILVEPLVLAVPRSLGQRSSLVCWP